MSSVAPWGWRLRYGGTTGGKSDFQETQLELALLQNPNLRVAFVGRDETRVVTYRDGKPVSSVVTSADVASPHKKFRQP